MLDYVIFYLEEQYMPDAYCSWDCGVKPDLGRYSAAEYYGHESSCFMVYDFELKSRELICRSRTSKRIDIWYKKIGNIYLVDTLDGHNEAIIVGKREILEKILVIFIQLVDETMSVKQLNEALEAAYLTAQI